MGLEKPTARLIACFVGAATMGCVPPGEPARPARSAMATPARPAPSTAPSSSAGAARAPHPIPAATPSSRRLRALARRAEAAAQLGADYITANTRDDGKLVYLRNLDPEVPVPRKYNVLRHAGALYALGQVYARWPTPARAAALGRSLRYFQERYVRPVPGHETEGRYAVWSHRRTDEAKLGGAGLALVAFTALDPPFGDPAVRTGLARFIVSMQRPDGSFFSKYFVDRGPDDRWTSLYYPGEAALGLLRLHDVSGDADDLDPAPREVATAALRHLAEQRRGRDRVPPDHWALIATAQRLAQGDLDSALEADLRRHAGQVIDGMLTSVDGDADDPAFGAFHEDGRTTPTATRLEGMLAMRPFLRDRDRAAAVDDAAPRAIAFLLRAQRTEGPHPGAVPRAVTRREAVGARVDDRAKEVRIDYVQHAVSAWLAFAALHPEVDGDPASPADDEGGQVDEVERRAEGEGEEDAQDVAPGDGSRKP
ncbi:MAG: hypothetical protein AAGN82_05260 [Myxococcota bacterium]